MTTQVLEQFEAEEVSEQVLAELEEQARAEGESLAVRELGEAMDERVDYIETVVFDCLEAMDERIRETMGRFGTWLSDLHLRLGEMEARALRGPAEVDRADVDAGALADLAQNLDSTQVVTGHVEAAANELAKALYELGEISDAWFGQAKDGADDNVEYAYWALMKAKADLAEMLARGEEQREEMLS